MSLYEIQFWVIVAVIIILVLIILLWPLVKKDLNSNVPRVAYDINVYKDQLLEIDADLKRGLLSQDQVEAARIEIKRRMLSAGEIYEKKSPNKRSFSYIFLIAIVCLCAPLGAVLLYLGTGSPNQPDQPLAERKAQQVVLQTQKQKNLIKATKKLFEHLQLNPNDLRGWTLLANAYFSQEDYLSAVKAFSKAYHLSERDNMLAADYAEAMVFAANSVVSEEAHILFVKSIEGNHVNAKARYYIGLYEAQQGDLNAALQSWIDLQYLSWENAPWLKNLNEQIFFAANKLGIDPSKIKPSPEAQALDISVKRDHKERPTESSTMKPLTVEDVQAAMGMSREDQNQMILSMVERLAKKMLENPNDKDGWLRLERAYRVLGEKDLADEAAHKAATLP